MPTFPENALDDLRMIRGHLGRRLEDVSERQQEEREDQVQQILRKDDGPLRRQQDQLPGKDRHDDDAVGGW